MGLSALLEKILGSKGKTFLELAARFFTRRRLRSALLLLVVCLSMMSFALIVQVTGQVTAKMWIPKTIPPVDSFSLIRAPEAGAGSFFEYGPVEHYFLTNCSGDVVALAPRIVYMREGFHHTDSHPVEVLNASGSWSAIYEPIGLVPSREAQIGMNYSSVIVQGSFLKDEDRGAVVVASSLLEHLGYDPSKAVGSKITIRSGDRVRTFTIKGVLDPKKLTELKDSASLALLPGFLERFRGVFYYPYANETVIMLLDDMRDLIGVPYDAVTEVIVKTNRVGRDMLAFAWRVTRDLKAKVGAFMVKVGPDENPIIILPSTSMVWANMHIIIIALVIVAAIIMDNLIGSLHERLPEISVWTSVGANPTHVAINFFTEGLFLGILGGILGYFLAFLVDYIIISMGGVYAAIFPHWTKFLDPAWFGTIFAVSIAVCSLSAIYPSRKASKLTVPSLKRKWRPSGTTLLVKKVFVEDEELPIMLTSWDEVRSVYNYMTSKVRAMMMYYRIKPIYPLKWDIPNKQMSCKFRLTYAQMPSGYAVVKLVAKETKPSVINIYATVHPVSYTWGEVGKSDMANLSNITFAALEILRKLMLRWRVEIGEKAKIERKKLEKVKIEEIEREIEGVSERLMVEYEVCPHCGERVPKGTIICPSCHRRIKPKESE